MVKIKILERQKIGVSLKGIKISGDYTPVYQDKIITPTKTEQKIKADADFDALKSVTVKPIPSEYIKPEGSLTITENDTFDVTEKAEVNVQVVAKPEKPYIDSSKLKYGAYMFSNAYGTDLSLLENIDTREMVEMQSFLQRRSGVYNLKLNTDSVKNLNYAFEVCADLESVELTKTSQVDHWTSTFRGCRKLKRIITPLTFSDNATGGNTLAVCDVLEYVRFDYIGVKANLNFLNGTNNLTVESLLSILNALSDNMGLDTTYTVALGSANIAKLTDEQLAIAYNKNILLQ